MIAYRNVGFTGILFLALLFAASRAAAQDPQADVQAQLAAGEFPLALETAGRVPSVERRNDLLAQIALAQAQAGARTGAIDTAGRISDDRARAAALQGMGTSPLGGQGGGTMADFDSLIQLITATIQPDSWDDVGGPGSVAPFETGIRIDADGTLQKIAKEDEDNELARLRVSQAIRTRSGDVRHSSPLRKISLPRLEKQIQLRAAAGKAPTETMEMLAGLRRIEYVFVYPETRDLVIAGPAGDWQLADEDRIVSTDTGEPIVRLDDLVVVLRQMTKRGEHKFGCLIVPTQEGLARVKAFAEQSAQKPLKAGTRRRWLAQLQEKLGKQNLEVYGIDPRTRVASVMLEADYHMKLIGMGIEPGVPGVESYLDLVRKNRYMDPTMSVLRWWFTLNYDAVTSSEQGDAFAFRGPGAKVLSENEMLAADGRRVHTGQSEKWNREFAAAFTRNFEALSQRYPVYAELRNVCDLAMVGALIRRENLAEAVGWHMLCLGDDGSFPVRLGPVPKKVDSVIGCRSLGRGQLIVGVSGGVRVDPGYLLATGSIKQDEGKWLTAKHADIAPPRAEANVWWWD